MGFAELCCGWGSLGGRLKLKVQDVSSGVPLGTLLMGREEETGLGRTQNPPQCCFLDLSRLSHLLCAFLPHPPRDCGYQNTERKTKDWVLSFWGPYCPRKYIISFGYSSPEKCKYTENFAYNSKGLTDPKTPRGLKLRSPREHLVDD